MLAARALAGAFLVLTVVAAPSAGAWVFPSTEPTLDPATAAWTTAFARPLVIPPDVSGIAMSAAACALGDVNGDAIDDILVRVKETADGPPRLKALAGPDFTTVIWQVATTGDRVLQCAPDLSLDGIGDPVTTLASSAAGGAGAPVENQAVDRAMQVLDGATGLNVIQRQHQDQQTSGGSSSGGTGVSANSSATANLLPAAAGAEAYVQVEIQQSQLLGLPGGLPVGDVTATARSTAELQLLDAMGGVQGTVTIDDPGVQPLAMAPLPVGAGLPNVAALTAQTLSPVEEAASQVPTLSLYNPDGSLAWAVQLDATEGLPVLVPRAGDLNLDGIQEIIVENAQTGVQAAGSAQYLILSGIDGTELLNSGAPIDGLMAALPLGALPDGVPGVLSIEQVSGAGSITLKALSASGQVAWSADIAAGSIPLNARLDAYTGDPLGFTDLTGDGLPDIGTAVREADALVLTAINGTTGSIAWNVTLPNVSEVLPFSPASTLKTLSSAVPTVPSDLLAIGVPDAAPALTLLDGATGEVVWTVTGALPSRVATVQVTATAAGDLNKDGVMDLLAMLSMGAGAASFDSIYALSGSDGSTLWSNATEPSHAGDLVALASTPGSAFGANETRPLDTPEQPAKDTPSLGAGILLAVLACLAWVRRPRK